jgi:hypothetical protein
MYNFIKIELIEYKYKGIIFDGFNTLTADHVLGTGG